MVLRVIALETSERIGTLAALRVQDGQTELLCSRNLSGKQRTAQSLLPALQELLEACGWKPQDLTLVCTTRGPGSFTGLRLGITTAKTLAYATGAELVGISTLAAIGASVPTEHERLWTILDAQRRELFVACFEKDWQSGGNNLPPTHILRIEDWLKQLRTGDLVAGSPLKKLGEYLPLGVEAVAPEFWAPQATRVGHLGIAAHKRGQAVDPMQLVPEYFRKSAAEEKAERGNDK